MSSSIQFFFDFVSPYAYLASTQIHSLALRHERTVSLVPVLFAALLDAHGTVGPAEVPARRRYLAKDVTRLAHRFGVRLEPPAEHPFNPLLALRVASVPMDDALRRKVVDALFAATWAASRRVADESVVLECATAAGLPPVAVSLAVGEEGKARLRTQTDEALDLGVFGVPSMVVEGEIFWGMDSLPHLECFLGGEDPVSPEQVARWAQVPSTARRRGA